MASPSNQPLPDSNENLPVDQHHRSPSYDRLSSKNSSYESLFYERLPHMSSYGKLPRRRLSYRSLSYSALSNGEVFHGSSSCRKSPIPRWLFCKR